MMNIKPSEAIRENYNEISQLCKSTGQPVYLTKNGEGDLVVMDLDTFARRESMLRLREKLLQSDADILNGRVHTVDEAAAAMSGEFDEQILADLISQGFEGQELLEEFKRQRKKVRPAVQKMIEEADALARSGSGSL